MESAESFEIEHNNPAVHAKNCSILDELAKGARSSNFTYSGFGWYFRSKLCNNAQIRIIWWQRRC